MRHHAAENEQGAPAAVADLNRVLRRVAEDLERKARYRNSDDEADELAAAVADLNNELARAG
jgi:hypothetical protein